MNEDERYTVWVGGTEVSNCYLTHENAQYLADQYSENGYDDVLIEDTVGMRYAMTYKVEIQFKKGPTYSVVNVPGETKSIAETRGINDARAFGCKEQIKKVIVTEMK